MNDIPEQTERIDAWQQAINENMIELHEIKEERLRVEQEALQCTKEMERRAELMLANSRVIDVLQLLGQMLQEERRLSEQLADQASEHRRQKRDLEETAESLANKTKVLTMEIMEVQQRLAEARTGAGPVRRIWQT